MGDIGDKITLEKCDDIGEAAIASDRPEMSNIESNFRGFSITEELTDYIIFDLGRETFTSVKFPISSTFVRLVIDISKSSSSFARLLGALEKIEGLIIKICNNLYNLY